MRSSSSLRLAAGRAARLAVLAVAAGAALAGCIDPIDLDIEAEEGRVVVDALVKEGPGPHVVRLSFAGAFERGVDALQEPIAGAEVQITDADGAVVRLDGTGGTYRTAAGALVARVGGTYALRARLPDGRVFASTPETLLASPAGARASTAFVVDTTLVNQTLVPRPRIELRVDTPDPAGEANFYRWVWTGEREFFIECGFSTPPELCGSRYAGCRGDSRVEVASDRLVDGGLLQDQVVAKLPYFEFGPLLTFPFYAEVEQQALTPGAFAFWDRVRQTRDQTGGLFDPAPDAIVGNVANVDDPKDYALGYFTVVGTTTTAVCSTLADFPNRTPLPATGATPPFPRAMCPGEPRRTPSPGRLATCQVGAPTVAGAR